MRSNRARYMTFVTLYPNNSPIKYNNNNSVDSPTTFTTKFLNTFSFVIKNTWRASIFLKYKLRNKKVYHSNRKKIKIRRWLKSVSTAHSTRWWNTKTKRTDRHTAHAHIRNSGERDSCCCCSFPFTQTIMAGVSICRWALTVVSSFFSKFHINKKPGEYHEDRRSNPAGLLLHPRRYFYKI